MIFIGKRALHGPWDRLSTTQRLTARGLGIVAGVSVLAAFLGAADRPLGTHRLFNGTASLAGLDVAEEALDPVETEKARHELLRAQGLLDFSARFNVGVELAGLIYDIAIEEGIDPELGFRVVYVESRFNPRAISSAGALGLAQLMPKTARTLGIRNPFHPVENVEGGTKYLREMLDRYGDVRRALAAYNAGPEAVDRYRGIPPYRETRNYVIRVLNYYRAYYNEFSQRARARSRNGRRGE